MRLIIAGSRGITEQQWVTEKADAWVALHGRPDRVLCGDAQGPDRLGAAWARAQAPPVPVSHYQAAWDVYGARAGHMRNCQMADNADGLLALWDGRSKGTAHMISIASRRGLAVVVWVMQEPGVFVLSSQSTNGEGLGVL